jgi:hypothetical protein
MARLVSTRRALLAIVSASLLLAVATVFAPIGRTQSFAARPLTLEQARLVAEKAAYLQRQAPGRSGPAAGPESPSRPFRETVLVTTADLVTAAEDELAEASYRERLLSGPIVDRDDGNRAGPLADSARRAALDRVEADLAEARRQLAEVRELPDTHVEEVSVAGVEVGAHSIAFSSLTYAGATAKDPINLAFYRNGSAPDVYYDLRTWTSRRWQGTACGTTQRVYVWDAGHTGGWDGWQSQYRSPDGRGQLQRDAGWYCGSPRYHLRLFSSHVPDSDVPGFGEWSVAGAHHDEFLHLVAGDWEQAEGEVLRSLRLDGAPLWFVGRVWTVAANNKGTYQGSANDGLATFVELLY